MLKSSNKAIKACKQKEDLLDEWKYYIKHVDRQRGFAKEYVMIGCVIVTRTQFVQQI